ncbi:carbohydrate-binding family 9-like protein [Cohnella cholangitidis]|uniref:carbohydrate-binding family 9-like protein n=1 Tax=Cohnella cholangitidis TaxID=2598458 RepID=UPI0015FC834F|nr:carbohydrate-binding family 9-like protein [Cohnella cholangitidis]
MNGDLEINGDLSKPEWRLAAEVNLRDAATGQEPKQATTARLLWNERWLYAAFHCADAHIYASMTNFNDPIYNEEVVELFIDDNCDLKSYIEIEVNPLNACLHYAIHNDLNGHLLSYARTEQTIVTAVHVDKAKGSWSAELGIPLREFASASNIPPIPGDAWLFNLYRIDRPPHREIEFSAWSPTGEHQFHRPHSFGRLLFR